MEEMLTDTKQNGLLFDALMEAAVDAIIVSDAK